MKQLIEIKDVGDQAGFDKAMMKFMTSRTTSIGVTTRLNLENVVALTRVMTGAAASNSHHEGLITVLNAMITTRVLSSTRVNTPIENVIRSTYLISHSGSKPNRLVPGVAPTTNTAGADTRVVLDMAGMNTNVFDLVCTTDRTEIMMNIRDSGKAILN